VKLRLGSFSTRLAGYAAVGINAKHAFAKVRLDCLELIATARGRFAGIERLFCGVLVDGASSVVGAAVNRSEHSTPSSMMTAFVAVAASSWWRLVLLIASSSAIIVWLHIRDLGVLCAMIPRAAA